MNKPQLSAELEKRFDEAFPNEESGYLNKQGKYVHLFNPAVDTKEIKTFLATALEEQKEEVIEELLKHMRKVMFEWHGTGWAMVDDYKERFLNRKE